MSFATNTKKGSFFLEAAITIPIFLLGILVLASIITIVARCENINFILYDEMELLQQRAIYSQTEGMARSNIKRRIDESGSMKEFHIDQLRFKYSDGLNDDLIRIRCSGTFAPKNIFDWDSQVHYSQTILARAFTGVKRPNKPIGEEEFLKKEKYEAVYIFPNSGKKYHQKSCTYVNSYPHRTVLTEQIKGKYDGCRICAGYEAVLGQMVYCFEYGDAYHFRNCPTIDKYVIEIDKEEAINTGFLPCLKCGG